MSSNEKPRGRLLRGAVCVKEYTDKINYATKNSWTTITMTMQAGHTDMECEQKTTGVSLLLWRKP